MAQTYTDTLLFNDTFTAANGSSWSGTFWGLNGGAGVGASIQNNQGVLTLPATINSNIKAWGYTVDLLNADIVAKVTKASAATTAKIYVGPMNDFASGGVGGFAATNGVWVEFTNQANSTMSLKAARGGVLSTGPVTLTPTWASGAQMSVRVRREGDTIYLKVWSGTEPVAWNVSWNAGAAALPIDKSNLRPFLGLHNPSTSAASTNVNFDDVVASQVGINSNFTDTPATISVLSRMPTITAVNNSNVNPVAGLTSISVSVRQPTVLAQRNPTEPAGVANINVGSGNHGVNAVKNVNFQAQNVAINVVAQEAFRNTATGTAQITRDATTNTNAPTINYGQELVVSVDKNNEEISALFDFNPPEGRENVFKAIFRYNVSSANGTTQYWRLYAITSDWDENTVTGGTIPTRVYVGDVEPIEQTADGYFAVDVTPALALGAYGFGFGNVNFITTNIASSESATPPRISITYEVNPVSRTISAPVATLSLTATGHTATVQTNVDVNAQAIGVSVDASGADIFATDTVLFQASPAQIDVTLLDARGGDPNVNVSATAADITVLAPNGAEGFGGTDVTVAAVAATITITTLEASMSNITDVQIQAETIGVRIKLVGFYNRDEDKWADWIEASLTYPDAIQGTGDRWFRFEETQGTLTAVDSTGNAGATYNGNPTLRTEALDSRHAVTLDGIDDFIELQPLTSPGSGDNLGGNPFGTTLPQDVSVEMVFRTTSTGTLFSGGGFGLEVTENGLRWVQDIVTQNGFDLFYAEKFLEIFDSKVNDNKWHHLVWFANDGTGRNSLMIDGKIVWSRAAWNNWSPRIPSIIGRRVLYSIDGRGYGHVIELPARHLQADVMEFVQRNREGYGRDQGLRSYYILNNHTLVDATVADTIVVRTGQESKGRGNQKKMLVLWGNGETNNPRTADTYNVWFSSWSGVTVPRSADGSTESPHYFYNLYAPSLINNPVTINYKGYKVYFAHMYEASKGSTQGVVTITGEDYYYNNQTGEPRYIDVNTDLSMDIEDFDTVHVLHWPAPNQTEFIASDALPYFFNQTEFDYDREREVFKDSLRLANDKGVGLWITEGIMAVDFGIAQGWDVHVPQSDARGVVGTKADQRDRELSGAAYTLAGGQGGLYDDTYFVRNRRIVASLNDFSEFPTTYVSERIVWESFDRLKSHASAYAHNLTHLTNGLSIGTEFTMMVGGNWQGSNEYRSTYKHYGLNPEGIVGTVVAQEELTYFKGTEEVQNPNQNYVTTVLLDRGTILQGRPTGARIFVELMDNDWIEDPIEHVASVRNLVNGSPTTVPSTWDYDSRRNKELFFYNSYTYFRGDTQVQGEDIPVTDMTDLPVNRYNYIGMNDRGLNWLSIKPNAAFGDAQVFATVAKINVQAKQPVVTVVKHVTVAAQPATIKVEVRKPQNIPDPDVQINADVSRINILGGTYQTIVYADVAIITISTPESKTAGEGEDFIVYLRSNDFTLYLGED